MLTIWSRNSNAAFRGFSLRARLRETLINIPCPSLRRPVFKAASKSPPCVPMPGARNHKFEQLAYAFHSLDVSCTDNKTNIIIYIPRLGKTGNVFI